MKRTDVLPSDPRVERTLGLARWLSNEQTFTGSPLTQFRLWEELIRLMGKLRLVLIQLRLELRK
jgi:hypothetical protein